MVRVGGVNNAYSQFNLIIILCFISFPLISGQLDDFEKEASTTPENKSTNSTHTHRHCRNDQDCDVDSAFIITELVLRGFLGLIEYGGEISNARMDGSRKSEGILIRKNGELLLPFFRLDSHIQIINQDLVADDYRLELGRGALGLQFRFTNYRESNPDDELSFRQLHFLYRLSFGNRVGHGFSRQKTIPNFDPSRYRGRFDFKLTII